MNITVDEDIKAVLEMMQRNIPASRLVAVANGVQKIAPILWGQYEIEEVKPLYLTHDAILGGDLHTQSSSILQTLDS